MSGENDYVKQKANEFEIELDDIERKLGLKHLVHNPEAERLLSLTEIELDKMTATECANAKYLLLQYALSVQKTMNRATAVRNWAERNINVILAKEFKNFSEFMKGEVKRQAVISNNTYAQRLGEFYNEQQGVIDTLIYIAQAANSIAGAFQTLCITKSKVEGSNYE
jgi:hypothetical protein